MAKSYSLGSLTVISLLLLVTGSQAINPLKTLKSAISPTSNDSTILDAPKNLIRDAISLPEGEVCYPLIGCFSLGDPWTSLLRPLPAPWSPKEISPKVKLYTRNSEDAFNISLNSQDLSWEGSDYDRNRPVTVVITHGFANTGEAEWLYDLVKAYLKNIDANAFILDWGDGATITNYLQVASNTRIVGASLARLLRELIDDGLETNKIHLIGHSLGAHIMSYCAKNISEISKIKRLTGLDPAQPGFEGTPAKVRLDKTDAEEVDVIHTDAKPFIPFIGFGILSPVGTVDFYLNGGSSQPGCLQIRKPNITGITDLVKYPVEVVAEWVGCSHGRSYEYFTAALNEKNCTFGGRKMMSTETFLKVSTVGMLKLADPVIKELTSCTRDTCTIMGLETFDYPARGSFAVTTSGEPPYCVVKGEESKKLRNSLSSIRSFASNALSYIGKKLRFL